jgi:hypothetical protein
MMRMKQIYPCETRRRQSSRRARRAPEPCRNRIIGGCEDPEPHSGYMPLSVVHLVEVPLQNHKLPRGRLSPERLPMDADDMVQLKDRACRRQIDDRREV